ncbi:GLPGLI family protein [Flavobacterium sp. J27]|uniref:GLPGLI family protein n=1 Tax=Flavobacterium sp. J27 TaxID=2060419 RepID=UPI00102F5DE6|nr:GLPGLI family protein [Flavobacterium sp. J27]
MQKLYFLLFVQLLFSQSDVSDGKIEYKMILGLTNITSYNATVLFNSKLSLFEHKLSEEEKLYSEKQLENGIVEIIKRDSVSHFLLIDKNKKKVLELMKIFNENMPVIVEEDIPEMNWDLQEGTKQIGKYYCNQATTTFRGRNYTAWYSLELPYNIGPWKFNNLPGVILEVKDDTNEVMYTVTSITIPYNVKIKDISKNVKTISRKEYLIELDDYLKNFESRSLSKANRNVSAKISIKINTIEKE